MAVRPKIAFSFCFESNGLAEIELIQSARDRAMNADHTATTPARGQNKVRPESKWDTCQWSEK
jgi:hypothetical protein